MEYLTIHLHFNFLHEPLARRMCIPTNYFTPGPCHRKYNISEEKVRCPAKVIVKNSQNSCLFHLQEYELLLMLSLLQRKNVEVQ